MDSRWRWAAAGPPARIRTATVIAIPVVERRMSISHFPPAGFK
jgi:hypothetical protein